MFRSMLAVGLATVALGGVAAAQTCAAYPYPLVNGQTADAVQLMANFNCAASKYNPSFTGPVVIGAPYHGDASLHITSAYGGFGRLTQISPSGPNAPAFNLMGSIDASGNGQWWSWGVNNGVWTMTPGTAGFVGQAFTINGAGVGIATTSAGDALSVHGNADFGVVTYPYNADPQYGALTFPRGQIMFSNANTQNQLYMASNAYISGGTFAFRTSDKAAAVGLDMGKIWFLTAGSGGYANTAIPWINGMTVDTTGYVGIGTASPGYSLQVVGTAAATSWATTSDGRLKNTVQSLRLGALDTVKKLRPVSFAWNKPTDAGMRGEQTGFIAQEVQKILPNAVLTGADENKTLAIKYTELIPILTAAIQEQQTEIETLKARLAKLEGGR